MKQSYKTKVKHLKDLKNAVLPAVNAIYATALMEKLSMYRNGEVWMVNKMPSHIHKMYREWQLSVHPTHSVSQYLQ